MCPTKKACLDHGEVEVAIEGLLDVGHILHLKHEGFKEKKVEVQFSKLRVANFRKNSKGTKCDDHLFGCIWMCRSVV
jgi:hypothetical protein